MGAVKMSFDFMDLTELLIFRLMSVRSAEAHVLAQWKAMEKELEFKLVSFALASAKCRF
jgi:hypothetical protein